MNQIDSKSKQDISMLLEVIGGSPENRMLDFLLEGKGIDYSISDLAEGCGISRPTTYKVLAKLFREKVVEVKRKVGNITLYQLNLKNEKVQILLGLEETLLKKSFADVDEKDAIKVKNRTATKK